MVHLNILGLAIPFFTALILLEFIISKKRGLIVFNLHNTIANVSIGIAERLSDVFVAGIFYFIYDTIQRKYGLFHIDKSVFMWIALLLLTDFIWYWYHRFGHEVNIFWMAHIVHHQSEDYNLTVSARITLFQAMLRHGFWLILPLLGFPATMVTVVLLIHGLYPFFVHTRLIGKLGLLEYILVTPSHHRVHHASNEQYLDKNFGDIFIIWDKLFGTFVKEEEEPVYGLTKPLNSYSFLWQHFHFFIETWLAVNAAKGIKNKCKILFGSPETINPHFRKKAELRFNIQQNSAVIEKPLNKYVIWQILSLLIGLTIFLLFERDLSLLTKISFSLVTLITLINCGAIMEQKKWVFYLEFVRLSGLLILPFSTLSYLQIKISLVLLVVILLTAYFDSVKKVYLTTVFK